MQSGQGLILSKIFYFSFEIIKVKSKNVDTPDSLLLNKKQAKINFINILEGKNK